MMVEIPKSDLPVIHEWGKDYFKDKINVDCIWQACEWCMLYAKNSPDKDTKNVLFRLNIGIYQLSYINKMMNLQNAPAAEWSEAIASSMIHFLGCVENIGMDCASLFKQRHGVDRFSNITCKLQHLNCDLEAVHYRLLCAVPSIIQQVYYFEMGRANRFDGKKLSLYGMGFLEDLIILNMAGRLYLPIEHGLAFAMSKLIDVELNRH